MARDIDSMMQDAAAESMRNSCEELVRAAADALPESYKRSKKKLLEVADAIAALALQQPPRASEK